jgi:hypothetical protein
MDKCLNIIHASLHVLFKPTYCMKNNKVVVCNNYGYVKHPNKHGSQVYIRKSSQQSEMAKIIFTRNCYEPSYSSV